MAFKLIFTAWCQGNDLNGRKKKKYSKKDICKEIHIYEEFSLK